VEEKRGEKHTMARRKQIFRLAAEHGVRHKKELPSLSLSLSLSLRTLPANDAWKKKGEKNTYYNFIYPKNIVFSLISSTAHE
jgi:hypothetical protein